MSCICNHGKRKKFTLFSDRNGSLLRRQPGAMTIGHSPICNHGLAITVVECTTSCCLISCLLLQAWVGQFPVEVSFARPASKCKMNSRVVNAAPVCISCTFWFESYSSGQPSPVHLNFAYMKLMAVLRCALITHHCPLHMQTARACIFLHWNLRLSAPPVPIHNITAEVDPCRASQMQSHLLLQTPHQLQLSHLQQQAAALLPVHLSHLTR